VYDAKLTPSMKESLSAEDLSTVKETKKDVIVFVDGLIDVINKQTGDIEVTRNSSTKQKMEFARTLSQELNEEFKDMDSLKELIRDA
jgi:hypothetical protein